MMFGAWRHVHLHSFVQCRVCHVSLVTLFSFETRRLRSCTGTAAAVGCYEAKCD